MTAMRYALLILLCGITFVATAQQIGRTKLVASDDSWGEIWADQGVMPISGVPRDIRSVTKIFLLLQRGGESIALLSIRSDQQGTGGARITWNGKCPASKGSLYANAFGTEASSQRNECLIVNDRFLTRNFVPGNKAVSDALEAHRIRSDQTAVGISSTVATKFGSFVSVQVLLAGGSFSKQERTESTATEAVSFGKAVHAAVVESTQSMVGTLHLPTMPSSF